MKLVLGVLAVVLILVPQFASAEKRKTLGCAQPEHFQYYDEGYVPQEYVEMFAKRKLAEEAKQAKAQARKS